VLNILELMSFDLQIFGGGGRIGAVLMCCCVTGEPLEGRMNRDSWGVDGFHLCLDGR